VTTVESPTITVYGAPWCPHCKRVKKFLAGHRVRYDFVNIDEHPEAIHRLQELQGGAQIIPTVVYGDGTHDVNPSDESLAAGIGLTLEAERTAYDLVIVGGGPAGLAAAIYAAREGIDAIVVEGAPSAGRQGSATGSTTIQGSPTGSQERIWPSASSPRPVATVSSSFRPCRRPRSRWTPRTS
jgi:thioredoxin reductase (NADPH)